MKFPCIPGPLRLRLIGAFAGGSIGLLLASCGGEASDAATSSAAAPATASTTTITAANPPGETPETSIASAGSGVTVASLSDSRDSGASVAWNAYASPDGRYIAKFPAPPRPMKGTLKDAFYLAAVTVDGSYVISSMAFGTTLTKAAGDRFLDYAAKLALAKGTPVLSETTTFQGFPARDVIMEKEVRGKVLTCNDMIFWVGDHFYMIMTVAPKDPGNAANFKKFTDGFKLVGRR